jgi:hypothetical protein
MSKATSTMSIDCKCDETFIVVGVKLDYNEIMTVTHECGAKIYVGSVIDYNAELVDVFAPPLKLAYASLTSLKCPKFSLTCTPAT